MSEQEVAMAKFNNIKQGELTKENIDAQFCSDFLKDEIRILFRRADRLEEEVKKFMAGVNNFRCPSCKAIAGPYYPINLCSELDNLGEENKRLREEYEARIGKFRECLNKIAEGTPFDTYDGNWDTGDLKPVTKLVCTIDTNYARQAIEEDDAVTHKETKPE